MNMRSCAAAILLVLLASGCRVEPSPGYHEGPPPFMPAYPGSVSPDKRSGFADEEEMFFEHGGCAGRGYVAEDGDEFTYASVRVGNQCREESGAGFGYAFSP
jgi:hypothetical protein